MRTSYPGHLRTFDYLGLQRYFLTFCTDYRARFFVDAAAVDLVLHQFRQAAADQSFAISSYCFMPDHVHLLVEGLRDDADCRAFIKRAKQFSGFYFSRAHRRRLWQRYAYEHVLRNDQAALAVARYIIENPVRAGLVADPRTYPFLGSDTYTLDEIMAAVGEFCGSE